MMTILRARDIADAIAMHSEAERRAAFAALHASADLNKDQRRASADRVLAQAIWDSFGDEPVTNFTAWRHPVLAVTAPSAAPASVPGASVRAATVPLICTMRAAWLQIGHSFNSMASMPPSGATARGGSSTPMGARGIELERHTPT